MKWLAMVMCAICVTGCSQVPEKTLTTSNQDYSVSLLFTDENGNKIYRFTDAGEYQYYIVGPGGVQMLPTHTVRTEVVPGSGPVLIRGGKIEH